MDNNMPSRSQYHQTHQKKTKRFYKRWWFWLIIAIILLAGGGFEGMKLAGVGPFGPKTEKVAKKTTTKKKKTTTKKQTGITVAQYNGVYLSQTDGLTLATIEKIFGKPANTTNTTVQNISTNAATWTKIADGGLGATLTINFANDHAISKSLNGLKITRNTKLGLNEYNMVQNDQSQADVISSLGKPNGYSEIIAAGTNTGTMTYSSGINGDTGSNFIINFENGKVSGKSQTGLK